MLLSKQQRKKIFQLQLLVILMSFAEVVSVLAIGPFMAVVGDITLLQGQGIMAKLYKITGFENPSTFLAATAIVVLFILLVATLISLLTMWLMCTFGIKIGTDLSVRAYKYYMYRHWLFHASGNSNRLINKIAQECERITLGIIHPMMLMNAKLIMAICLSLAILIYNPWIAISAAFIFSISYFVLFKTVRRKLYQNGLLISEEQEQRFKLMGEGFGGIKDTLLMGRQATFTYRFSKASGSWAHAVGINQALGLLPRNVMEFIAFGTVIFLVLYLLTIHNGSFTTMLPVLGIFALAGYKLLPCFQQIYISISSIRANIPAFDNLSKYLYASVSDDKEIFLKGRENTQNIKNLYPVHSIKFKDVAFQYPNTQKPTINGINFEIPANKVVGIVGSS
ncbi:MAG: ABC transporter transmembrane domain-containing protein, partial [Pseudomonadota bacterium]|nr:ABC transporter transmembrane domain-containing protein [Pseudomonadota bacterium]